MSNTEKIQRVITRIKCGMKTGAACDAEGLPPMSLYKSDLWKEYKMSESNEDQGDAVEQHVEQHVEREQPHIKIVRLPETGDPRSPMFEVQVLYAGDVSPGVHHFTTVQGLVAQLPQLTFGLTP